jgi:hypothetical protein
MTVRQTVNGLVKSLKQKYIYYIDFEEKNRTESIK